MIHLTIGGLFIMLAAAFLAAGEFLIDKWEASE